MDNTYIIGIYVKLIKGLHKTIDDVPPAIREEVRQKLEEGEISNG